MVNSWILSHGSSLILLLFLGPEEMRNFMTANGEDERLYNKVKIKINNERTKIKRLADKERNKIERRAAERRKQMEIS